MSDGQSGALVGQGSALIVLADVDTLSQASYGSGEASASSIFGMGTIDSIRTVLTQSVLDALCEKYHIPDHFHPELPPPNSRIRYGPVGEIGLYSRFFCQLPDPFINPSQFSVIGAAKVSHFEILCRVHGFEPSIGNFRRFYVNSKNKGWMSFSKRPKNPCVCYTKPLYSLKNWNDHFFWIDSTVFPYAISWHTTQSVLKDPSPLPTEYDADICEYLAFNPAPFRKFPEPFLCFVGISRYYTLDEGFYPTYWDDKDREMDLFAFIHYADPTKVRIEERCSRKCSGESGRCAGEPGRCGQNEDINFEDDTDVAAPHPNQSEEGHVVQFGGIEIIADEETQAIAADKPKRLRKRKTADGASGSSLLPKRLSTLNAKVGAMAVVTVPFVTSSVTPTPEHEGGDHTDSVSGPNFRTQRPSERFVVSSDSTPAPDNNVVDDEVTSVVRSAEPVSAAPMFVNPTSSPVVGADIAGPSHTVYSERSSDNFFVSQDMDPRTFEKVYIPKWDVVNDSVLENPDVCQRFNDHLAPLGFFSQLWSMDYDQLLVEFNVGAALLKEKDLEIANLKAQLALKEAEVAKAIRLRVEASKLEATQKSLQDEMHTLKGRNATLEREKDGLDVKVVDLAASVKVIEQEVVDLDAIVISVRSQNDKLVDQVLSLESTCSGLHDEVSGYKLFKEHVEGMQDERMRALSDHVAGMDADLMDLALHIDKEFYPQFLTTISGRRWILSHGLKLVVTKCLQSPEYLTALGAAIGRAVDKGMQDGLRAGVDHGKAGRGLDVIAAYDPSAETNFVSALDALRAVKFPLLAKLESHKDAKMADLFDLILLEGPVAGLPGSIQLQPSVEQLTVPIHRLEDQVVIGEVPLSSALDVAHSLVQRLKRNAAACHLSLSDVVVPLVEPLSAKILVGEASSSMIPSVTATTALATTFASVSATEVPPLDVVFEEEELDTTPKHSSVS
ncbi:hypothetical protein Tco_1256762 [Tanacetum coccineum]